MTIQPTDYELGAEFKHVYSGKVRDLYEAPDGRLLFIASDRISAEAVHEVSFKETKLSSPYLNIKNRSFNMSCKVICKNAISVVSVSLELRRNTARIST